MIVVSLFYLMGKHSLELTMFKPDQCTAQHECTMMQY